MKRAKHLSSISKKLASVPELPYKKGLLNSSPKSKEKRNVKAQYDKIEPMVLRSPPTGESIVRYALPIPSTKTKDLIAEDEMVRRIAKHLKMVVTALENTYGTVNEDGERTGLKRKEESSALSVGDDMNAFLLCCSQFAAQLEEAVKEERNILESLFKWFQQQVNQMEEISKDQSNFEDDLPSDDKSVDLNISQIANLVHKFEELKNRLKEQRGSLVAKHMDKDILSEPMKSFEAIEKQIEEFIKSHAEYESQFVSEIEPDTPYSLTDRMSIMIKIFENQTNMLERALNDQSIIETKYKQMETDFQVLLLEKTILENEIQKMRGPEKAKPTSKDERTKKPARPERKKDSERRFSPSRETELAEIQREAESLKMEKRALQEQLKWALQEAERNKHQLDFVLHQEMEMYKEDRSKTKMEGAFSKTGDDSRSSDHDQMPPDKGERLEKKRSSSAVLDSSDLEGYYDVLDDSAVPPEVFKSFPTIPLIEEHLVSISTQPKETEMWSLMSFPDLIEEMEKAEASRQILSHTEAENFKVSRERPAPDDKNLLPETHHVPTSKQLASQGRRKPLFITTKAPDHFTLISRRQSEIENLEANKYDNLNDFEEQDKKIGKEYLKGQKGYKTGRPYTHEEESDESIKAKVSAKKPDTAKGKGLAPPDVDDDGTLSPDSPSSISKGDSQTKKQKMHKRERSTVSHEMPDKSSEHQDPELLFEIQAKKLKLFRPENAHSEVSDRSIKLEDQNVQSSSQVQLKKQKSLGGEMFTIHFAGPDEGFSRLHHEVLSEGQEQIERATTSEDARYTVPSEYQKKGAPVDNLYLEKKLITRSQAQSKKYVPPQEDNAEKKSGGRFFREKRLESVSMDQQSLKDQTKLEAEVQEEPQEEYQNTLNPVVSEIIFQLDMDRVRENDLQNWKETFERPLLHSEFKELSQSELEIGTDMKKMPARSKSKQPVKTELKTKEDKKIKIVKGKKLLGTLKDQQGVSSLKTKPQENINAKYHPPMTFPTKVINLLPFTSQGNMESSSPYGDVTPKPLYRTSRGSSAIPSSFQPLLNRRISGDLNPKNENKPKTELENQLSISITSSKKYVHKGQHKNRMIKKKGAEPHQNLNASTSSIKKPKLKGKGVTVTQPNYVKLVKRHVELPNNLKTTASAPNIKVIKELSKTSNLDDEDAKLSNELPKSTSAAKKPRSKESSKMNNLETKVAKGSNILHKSISSLKCVRKEPSKTKKLGKNEGTPTLRMSTNAKKMRVLQGQPKATTLNKKGVDLLNNLTPSASASSKRGLKALNTIP